MGVIELARFEVDPERAGEVASAHAELVAALREHAPGLVRLRLVRLDERTWLDLAEWTSREAADAGAAALRALPPLRFFELIAVDHPVEHGQIVSEAALELRTAA